MIILAINTASSRTGIALLESVPGDSTPKLLAENSWAAHNDEAEKLMPAIAKLLKQAGQTFSNIKQIYVIKGPGSFTGLRVGVTVANTIAYLNNCELFGITTFEYWHSVSDLPVVLYAGSGGVYLSLNKDAEPQLIKLDELNNILKKQKIKEIAGDISDDQIKILKKVKFMKSSGNFATFMKKIIAKNLQNKTFRPEKLMKPLYIKEPGITTPKTKIT